MFEVCQNRQEIPKVRHLGDQNEKGAPILGRVGGRGGAQEGFWEGFTSSELQALKNIQHALHHRKKTGSADCLWAAASSADLWSVTEAGL